MTKAESTHCTTPKHLLTLPPPSLSPSSLCPFLPSILFSLPPSLPPSLPSILFSLPPSLPLQTHTHTLLPSLLVAGSAGWRVWRVLLSHNIGQLCVFIQLVLPTGKGGGAQGGAQGGVRALTKLYTTYTQTHTHTNTHTHTHTHTHIHTHTHTHTHIHTNTHTHTHLHTHTHK